MEAALLLLGQKLLLQAPSIPFCGTRVLCQHAVLVTAWCWCGVAAAPVVQTLAGQQLCCAMQLGEGAKPGSAVRADSLPYINYKSQCCAPTSCALFKAGAA